MEIGNGELVVGDLVIIENGKLIPADCMVVDVLNLAADEADMTGESRW